MAQKNFADAMNQIVNGTNGLKSQINTKADKHSPNFTGTPTAVTAGNETDSTQLATTEFCQNLIRRLVGSAPETLNTLVELATAINNDPTFAQTIVQALDGKLNKTDAANTYATKAELSNVSVDTTNLAKLNASNTFLTDQTIYGGNLRVKSYATSDEIILTTSNRIHVTKSDGDYFFFEFKEDGIYLTTNISGTFTNKGKITN